MKDTRRSALLALFLGTLGLVALSGCSAGNPNMSAAETAMEQQDYDRALANVDTAITQDTANTNADARMMKARILRQKADSTLPTNEYIDLFEQAYRAEEEAVEIDPNQRSVVQLQREKVYRTEVNKGVKAFQKAGQQRSRDQYLKAAAYFGAAGAIKPDSSGPILNEAFARLRAARLQKGDAVMEEMSKVIPILERYFEKEEAPSKNAYDILSGLYLQNDQPKEAVELTERALEDLSQRPTHFRLAGNNGVKYAGTVTEGGSSRSVEGTVPDEQEVSVSDGMVSGAFYKRDGGKLQAKGQLQVRLNFKGSTVARGQTVALGDTVSVSKDLSGLSPLAELQNRRLNALNRTGNTERVMRAYKERIKENPDDATYRYNYGSLLLNANRYEAAAEQLEKAVELDPSDPKKQYNLGAAYLNRGVTLQDSLVSLRDSLIARGDNPTEEERKMVKELDQKRLSFFNRSIPPLERARQQSGPNGQYRQNACSALFQAYVQTEQTEKAEEVKECAGQSMPGNGGSGGSGGGGR